MTSEELRDHFEAMVGRAAVAAPDEYPASSHDSWAQSRPEIEAAWAVLRVEPDLQESVRDFIDARLRESLAAFDANDKGAGRAAMAQIYKVLALPMPSTMPN
jgi:hypothetical protein